MIINAWNDYVVENNQDASNTHLEYYIPDKFCDGGPMNDFCNVARFRSPDYPAVGQIKIMTIASGSTSSPSSGGYTFNPSYPPAPQRSASTTSSAGSGGGGPVRAPTPAPAPAPRNATGAIPPVVPAVITVTSFTDLAGEVHRQAEFQLSTARSGSFFDRTCKAFVDDPADHQLHFLYEGIEKKKPACDDFFMVVYPEPKDDFNVTDIAMWQSEVYIIKDVSTSKIDVHHIKTVGVAAAGGAASRTFTFIAPTTNYVLAVKRGSEFESALLRDHPSARKSRIVTEPAVAKRKAFYDPLDCKNIMQHEMANISERVRGSAVCRRMTEEALMKHVISPTSISMRQRRGRVSEY